MKKLTILCFLVVGFISCKKDSTNNPAPEPVIDYTANRFERNGLILNWESNNATFSIDIKKKLVETFFSVYPNIYNYFNPAVRKDVIFRIDTQYTGVAYANFQTGVIVFGSTYMLANPEDNDVVTHELTHIVQAYPKYDPVWLVEGMADFSRYKFGINNAAGKWTLPEVTPSQNYDNSYRVTARFLVWVDNKVKAGTPKSLDAAIRAGTYTEATWKTLTGKTVQELWADYVKNPAL